MLPPVSRLRNHFFAAFPYHFPELLSNFNCRPSLKSTIAWNLTTQFINSIVFCGIILIIILQQFVSM